MDFPTQVSATWPRREPHRRLQWLYSHAAPPPRTALRGPVESSTEDPGGCTRVRFPRLCRGPVGSSAESRSGCTRVLFPRSDKRSVAL
eukprot:423707-Pyramimonas_sp.AAC.1